MSLDMKRSIYQILFLVACCIPAQAQQVFTLEQCREMALKNNKATAIAERTEEKTNYESKSYYANFFPKISAQGSYLLTNNKFGKTIEGNYLPTFTPDLATGQLTPNILTMPDGTPIIGPDGNPVFKEYAYFPDMNLNITTGGTYLAGLSAEQPIYMGGKIIEAYKMSEIGKDIAQLNKNLTRAEIIVKTDEAHWLHLKALESKKVVLAFQKVIDELMQNVQAALKSGMKTKNDLLKVQVQMNKAELQLQQAENAIRLSRMNLCQIMGLPLDTEINISTDFAGDENTAQYGLPDGLRDYTARPEYSILEKQIELKTRQIKLVKSDFMPNIGVMANYGYMHGVKLNGTPLFDKASFSALFSVKIPIFHWGEGTNKIRAAKAEQQIVQLQHDDLSEKMELEMRKYQDKLDESKLEITLTARSLEQAEENMTICKKHYEAGMETLANCLEAQTLWQQAWLEMINAKINRHLNETYYLKATGGL
jgi:outer membrane protein TolC